MKVKKYKIPIYTGKLIVIYSKDKQSVVDKYNLNEAALSCGAFVFVKNNNRGNLRVYAVFYNKDLDCIAHESVHIVNHIFDYHFMQLDLKNDEPQAYLTGWVFDKIHSFIK